MSSGSITTQPGVRQQFAVPTLVAGGVELGDQLVGQAHLERAQIPG